MSIQKVQIADKLSLFSDHWAPRVIAEMNHDQFKLVKFLGSFVWHQHEDTDETFLVLHGSMCIEFSDQTIELQAGELLVVPKGVQHRPYADQECHVMLIEPKGIINTGETGHELTAANNVWI
ncbi:cupin domain-containing protein [Rheinheimera mangrovi]|uniref:cupin domain-containing protein n=1 Tax=Rheinheimera mangrovi TaxID=2498451 RepID=UPI000F8EE815|nr:cupin domain-containing protein [Rheinheimera mangrovi]